MFDKDSMKRLVAGKHISRRQFMQAATAAGITAASAGSMFSQFAMAATPKRGGSFKMGIGAGSTTDSLDPATTTHAYTQLINHATYNYLTEVNNKGELIGELAESWEASADARTWRFKLRKGVTFHNGKTVTAEDIIASINHHAGKDSKSAAKNLVEPITGMKVDGQNLVFSLKNGNADFPFLMSDYHLAVMPSKDGKVNATAGIGSGAYVLEKFEPGVTTKFKRNPNYWKAGRGNFDAIELLAIKDVAARTNALSTGQIHAMDRCDLKTVHLLKRNKKLEITQETGTQHYTLPMNAGLAPFNNNHVRMALKLGIDRDVLVKTVLRGYGKVANDHPIGPSQTYFNSSLPQHHYDPDKAKFHLKKAGMTSLKVDLSAADAAFAGAVDAAVLYQEQARKCGIDINVIREPDDGYWSNVWMKKPWSMSFWGGRPTEDWMFSVAFASSANWNEGFWKNEHFDTLLVAGRAELDHAKRKAIYWEMQDLVSNQGSVVIPMYASYVGAMSRSVGHNKIGANWDIDGLRALERWWFV